MKEYQAVLLIGFGGPTCAEEIQPFLANVLKGRKVSNERIEEVIHHYQAIGGKSPFNDLTLKQAKGLSQILKKEGLALPVYVGMRNWDPLLKDILEMMSKDGIENAIGIILAPHQGEASWGRYQTAIQRCKEILKQEKGCKIPTIHYCEPWFDHPMFIEAMADQLRSEIDNIPIHLKNQTRVLFTAHSVPKSLSHPYVEQIFESCRAVASKLNSLGEWDLVYQSRSGNPSQPWLEPDVCDVITDLGEKGCQSVLLSPIGFVCDHVEVLYDLDVEAQEIAQKFNIRFYRAPTVNDHPSFLRMLADVVKETLQKAY